MLPSNINVKNIVWSGKDFNLRDFVEQFSLPQIVKVEEGFMHATEEEQSLSASQLLTLHSIEKVFYICAFTSESHPLSLPVDSTAKLEIVCQPTYYEKASDLVDHLPVFVASVEKHPWLGIDVDDIIEVKSISKSPRVSFLMCTNRTTCCDIEMPLDYIARFKSMGKCPVLHPTMADIVKHCPFPVTVRYIDDTLKIIQEDFSAGLSFGINNLGKLRLKELKHTPVLLTTPWGENDVLSLPLSLKVRVVAALGALSHDEMYTKLCSIAHKSTNKQKSSLKFIKNSKFKVLLHEKEKPRVEEDDYCLVAPPIPSRDLKDNRRSVIRSVGTEDTLTCQPARCRSLPLDLEESSSNVDNFSMDDDLSVHGVFSDSFEVKEHRKSKLHSVKKVLFGFGNKVSKAAENIKSSKKAEEGNRDTVLSSHASSSGHAITNQSANHGGSYFEVQKLPINIQADRYNENMDKAVIRKKDVPVDCKIRNPDQIRTWTVEEVSECLPINIQCNRGTVPSSHARSSGHAITSQSPNHGGSYFEVQKLPINIQADRYNENMVEAVIRKKDVPVDCKIRNPDQIRTWTVEEVSECLRYCRLEDYVELFKKEMVDGALLADLDEDSLRSLGINNKLHVLKMLKIINEGWLPK